MVLQNIDEIIFTLHPVEEKGAALDFVSARVIDVLGYTPDEMIALGNTIIHPADLDNVQQKTREAFRSSATTTFQYRIKHRDGHYLWFENRLRGIGSGGSAGPTVFGVARDISDRLEVEDGRRRNEEDLQQAHKMEALGRLAGGIAHDFNNLLTTIGGNASFVLELLPAGESTTRDALGDILAACDRAARFTRQLLAFSRKQVLRPEPLQMGTVIGDMQQMLSRLLGPEYQLNVRLAPDLPPIASDRGQIEQVLLNLIVNARDAMPGGGPISIRARLTAAADADAISRMPSHPAQAVVLEVADQGGGIPAEIRERIFEPFFTTKGQGKGTGLGLAVVYGFVQQSGGHVELASGAGGTTFSIFLPPVAASQPAVAMAAPTNLADGRPLTVMVVDDEPGVRHLAAAMLRRAGYTVIEAGDAAEAERLADEQTSAIDVLLTDIVMPGIRGPELAQRLRTSRPMLRVVYMSGYRDTEPLADVQRGEAVFLAKPFVREALLGAVAPLANREGRIARPR